MGPFVGGLIDGTTARQGRLFFTGTITMKRLRDALEEYELHTEISNGYAYQLQYAVGRFERYLRRPARVDDLTTKNVNRWLKHERDAGGISDRSRANVRTSLLTLWKRFGADLNRDNVRSVIVTPKNPEAWHFDELEQVAKAAGRLGGNLINGLPRGLYMSTCLWFAYETGLRRGDVWRFDLEAFDADRLAAMTQHKTNRVHIVSITEETERDLRELSKTLRDSGDEHYRTPLRWPQSETTFYYWMRRAREFAGVDPEKRNRSLQHVRRTGATQVDSEGRSAWKFLGHTREGLDRRSYIDQRKTISPITPTRVRSHGTDAARA